MADTMNKAHGKSIGPRSPGPSYQQLLDTEKHPVPDCLRENTNPYLGSQNLSVDRYLSREFHEQEVEHVWRRIWQAVCRATEIAETGDTFVYDITRFSIIVTRTATGELKAFHNACLHRGRQLVDKSGNYGKFRCPYHAFSWEIDGRFKGAPCKWDFPHIKDDEFSLPEVQVDTWGGWVFINMDLNAVPLHAYLGVSVMVARPTHAKVPEGLTAREFIAQLNSDEFSRNHDRPLDTFATNAERMDSILYSIFPNFAPWAGFHPNITYRFRPNGDDHTTALMEIMVICQLPTGAERPRDVPVRRLGDNELFSEAPELGVSLGTIFDQDLFNMPMIQKGLHNVLSRELVLANYHEVRIRHFHQTIDKYINGEL